MKEVVDSIWYNETVFYHIHPLGFCGALFYNEKEVVSRIKKVYEWIPHLKKLGIGAVYFSPIFMSDYNGYDARNHRNIDERLGSNDDFMELVEELHKNDIKVILDAVFNHVSRNFFAFQELLKDKAQSRYRTWFKLDWFRDNEYGDGFSYKCWEGNKDFVEFDLENEYVKDYLVHSVFKWIDDYKIDGIRLNAANCLTDEFVRYLRFHIEKDRKKKDFFLLGEMNQGDYTELLKGHRLHSVTNYEAYEGFYSSFNSMNMFDVAHNMMRMFGSEFWCLYRKQHLFNFVDTYDVNRIGSMISNPNHLPLAYGIMISMPGIPCIYYGSEWGAKGVKVDDNNDDLCKSYEAPMWNELTESISKFIKVKKQERALQYGDYKEIYLTNLQYVFKREYMGEIVYVAINASEEGHKIKFGSECKKAMNLLTRKKFKIEDEVELSAYSINYWKWIK